MSKATFILIPGAGGDPWYWHLVVPKLERHGHEAIPVALPAADDSAGLPEYADAVVDAIADRDPARVVLVAQSLGGLYRASRLHAPAHPDAGLPQCDDPEAQRITWRVVRRYASARCQARAGHP